jgi:chromosome segregation ATPase
MQTMVRETWSDDRLDHLNQRVDEGFQQVDRRFEEVDRRFEQVDARFDRLDDRFASFEAEFKAMNRTLIQGAFGLIGTMIVTCGAIVATQL